MARDIHDMPDVSLIAISLAVALGKQEFNWVVQNLYPFSFLYKFSDPSMVNVKNEYKIMLSAFLNCFPDGKWRNPRSRKEIPIFTEQMNFLMEQAYIRSDRKLTINDITRLGFNNTMPQDIADYIYHIIPTLEEIAELKKAYGTVKDKKTVQEFRKNFLYPVLLVHIKVKSKDEGFIQRFEESHQQNNIDKKIKDLKKIFDQIDKSTENQMISQE